MADKKYVGSFRTEEEVLHKIKELKNEGYVENDIYVVTNDKDSLSIVRGQTDVDLVSADGNWLDKFIAFMSGDEPVRAAFHDMGFTEEESHRYYSDVKDGSFLLYVDKNYGTIYDDKNIDLGTGAGYVGTNIDSTDTAYVGDNSQEEHLQLHEERLSIDKERQLAGEVNVDKYVVEEQETVEVPVEREEVYIERRAVDAETAAGEVFDDGESIHIPVMEERVEVTKRPVVSEEIVVGKKKVKDSETVSETVRREQADIHRTDGIPNDPDAILERNALDNDPLEENILGEDTLDRRNKL
ncbi:DUF2382 domain-containing protein [Psychrobacillus sp. NEAU-3TGS]|uniref:YsnF/AvaK domain-containing protein n=1 Tax=Psychrobacillus sp. NEAU-3TGS TaxID=2995412 RepID=UPI002496C37B|nr:DUF2382 domain-containing protein [Psychrobacillus sp. NEAU-3TGS]MDI2587288.1 DUF2382 domain-containing protein [Psychrobacillus sp. NEAU-3TGS]